MHRTVGFWMRGMDRENGGIFTCLSREGEVYSTDKAVWMQGRAAWAFGRYARMFSDSPLAEDAARAAVSCADFADRYCRDIQCGGRMYFSVTAEGKPLRRRRYHFSESFFAMGCAEVYRLTGDEKYLTLALNAYTLIDRLESGEADPFAIPPKTEPGTRRMRSLSVPMIRLNLAMEMAEADPCRADLYLADAADAVRTILRYHFRPSLRATLENVLWDGDVLLGVSEGRLVNPGHDAECAGFLLRYGEMSGDHSVISPALDMLRFALESGWDREYGGIWYFRDCLGKEVDIPEQSMKLWWPHTEGICALRRAVKVSDDPYFGLMLEEVSRYAQTHFPDPDHGEWYGYLDRRGVPASTAKGGMFKGPFHLLRMYFELAADM